MKTLCSLLLLLYLYPYHSYTQSLQVQHKIDSLLALAKHETDTDKLSYHFYLISKYYKNFNKIKSLKYAEDAYNYVDNSQYDTLKSLVLERLAIAHFETEQLANALLFYKKKITLARKLKDAEMEANTLFNIALLYHTCDDPVNSLKYLKIACRLITEKNILNEDLILGINEAMATNWYKLDKLDSAEKYYEASLNSSSNNNLSYHLIEHYYNVAGLHLKKHDYKNCGKQLVLMHNAEVALNDYSLEAFRLYLNSELEFVSGNFKLAEKNAVAAIQLAKQNGYKEAAELAYAVLGKLKEKSNQADSALYYLKLSQLYRDSLKGGAVKNLLQFADTEMEEYQSALLDLKLKDQQKTVVLLTGGVVMLVILLGVTYHFLRREKILKRNIESKNKEIHEQNLKLLTQTNEMSSLMTTMEEILKEKSSQLNNYAFYNSHRLRGHSPHCGVGQTRKNDPHARRKTLHIKQNM
jgi:hypothetical protein